MLPLMPFAPGYVPWNKGRCIGQKRPFKVGEIETIRTALQERSRLRELAMFNLAIDSKLRGCDLIAIRIEDVLVGSTVRDRASILQRKTRSLVQFEIGLRARMALDGWIRHLGINRGPLFPSRLYPDRSLSVRSYARIVDSWVLFAGLERGLYGTHTLRRTKATVLYRQTGNLRAVQLLLGHKSIENTVRYLGVDVDDALELSGQVDI
jgi:integrase